jgi:hypothetical protein
MKSLDRYIWRSSISVATKIRLYTVYILPVLLYGAETWTMTKAMCAKVDAFDLWCQRRILRINFIQHVTIVEVRRRTGCPQPLSDIIRSRRLRLFGHIACADLLSDHRRALYSAIHGPPADWKRPRGRPQHTWTRTVEADLRPVNIGLHTAWHRAQDREAWRKLMRTATLHLGVRA